MDPARESAVRPVASTASARRMHRSQMSTPGPVIRAFTCFWSRPQNEQDNSGPPAARRDLQRRLPPADATIWWMRWWLRPSASAISRSEAPASWSRRTAR